MRCEKFKIPDHDLLRARLLSVSGGAGDQGVAATSKWCSETGEPMSLSSASAIARPTQVLGLPLRRMIRFVIDGIALTVAALVVLVVVRSPGIRLILCPYCFGFERLQGNIYVESDTPPAAPQAVIRTVQISRAKIAAFFTTRESDPVIFICMTERCYRRAGGHPPTRGMTFAGTVLVSPRRSGGVVLTHEWTHAEFLQRLGPRVNFVPAWFAEGLAVYVSDDRRYLAPASFSDRCLIDPAGELPETPSDWLQVTTHDTKPFARAGCRVSRWLARKGNGAVLELFREINSGRSFADAYR